MNEIGEFIRFGLMGSVVIEKEERSHKISLFKIEIF